MVIGVSTRAGRPYRPTQKEIIEAESTKEKEKIQWDVIEEYGDWEEAVKEAIFRDNRNNEINFYGKTWNVNELTKSKINELWNKNQIKAGQEIPVSSPKNYYLMIYNSEASHQNPSTDFYNDAYKVFLKTRVFPSVYGSGKAEEIIKPSMASLYDEWKTGFEQTTQGKELKQLGMDLYKVSTGEMKFSNFEIKYNQFKNSYPDYDTSTMDLQIDAYKREFVEPSPPTTPRPPEPRPPGEPTEPGAPGVVEPITPEPTEPGVVEPGVVSPPTLDENITSAYESGLISETQRDSLLNLIASGQEDIAQDYLGRYSTEAIEEVGLPTYEYEPSEEMAGIRQRYAKEAAREIPEYVAPELEAEYVSPTLRPEVVDTWFEKLNEWERVGDEQAIKNIQERLDWEDPYGVGSGDRLKSSIEALAEFQKERRQRAYGLATEEVGAERETRLMQYQQDLNEWEKKYGAQWAAYQTDIQRTEFAKQKILDIEAFEQGANQFASQQEMQAAWNELQNRWAKEEMQLKKDWEFEMMGEQFAQQESMAKMGNIMESEARKQQNLYNMQMGMMGSMFDLSKMGMAQAYETQQEQKSWERYADLAARTAARYDTGKKSAWDYIAPVAGTAIGGFLGGVGGAQVGYQMGQSLT